MNLNFRKTALLAGICSVFSLGYAPQLFAVSSTDTVEAVQQTKKITGVVSDAMGPIIGANVLEKGTTNGVITDIDGNFALNVKPGATIVVSFIGYVSQEIKITNQTTVNITLKEDSEMLDEVVVVGHFYQCELYLYENPPYGIWWSGDIPYEAGTWALPSAGHKYGGRSD